jgi:hypothetical protein
MSKESTYVFTLDVADVGSIETTIITNALTPKEVWDTRANWEAFVATSVKEWESMEEDKRESTVKIIKNALENVYDRANEWIPEALEVKSGNYIDVYFRIILTDIDNDIVQTERATTFKLREAEGFADDLVAELRPDMVFEDD